MAIMRIGVDLNLFEILSNSTDTLSVQQLADKTGAAPLLLGRTSWFTMQFRS